jgi:hypothetical protein
LKVEALDRTTWRACFGRGFGSVVRQTTKWNVSDDGGRARFRKVVWVLKPSTIKETKYRRTPLIRTLVIRIGQIYPKGQPSGKFVENSTK